MMTVLLYGRGCETEIIGLEPHTIGTVIVIWSREHLKRPEHHALATEFRGLIRGYSSSIQPGKFGPFKWDFLLFKE